MTRQYLLATVALAVGVFAVLLGLGGTVEFAARAVAVFAATFGVMLAARYLMRGGR